MRGNSVWYTGDPPHKMGELDNGTLTLLRDKDEHLHRNMNAYGVNAEIIDSGEVNIVVIDKVKQRLWIDVDTIKEQAILKTFKDEKQYFIPTWLLQPVL